MGYDVTLLVENDDYMIPTWVDFELSDHKLMSMSNPKIKVGPEDIMVIPEVFSNIHFQSYRLLPLQPDGLPAQFFPWVFSKDIHIARLSPYPLLKSQNNNPADRCPAIQ